ncbi:hypothetical protein EYB53_021650 [Candidatus Chloroploca sp. M-50]|uniref:Uncharacterized protein n=1 Tax=Candidatus Chloroploca mongolica TaxID=2528176 RepID=A0ABS4DFY3_9CHLR|nr:hypothetical protein [Candidatus Chloroploca mongolica]MBP1468331.1 hypothetical protein [Candidatus Chloroploca mongolica]
MSAQLWLPAEIAHRMRILHDDIAAHTIAVDANEAGQGIHQSQVATLKTMMEVLLQRQDNLLTELALDRSPAAMAKTYADLLGEIAGSHGLWRLFRTIYAQRLDPAEKRLLDAADLVAEDCYRPCIQVARDWGLIDGKYREPPLVWIEAGLSPLIFPRQSEVRALGMTLRPYLTQRLPIPIIVLPPDHAGCFWLYATLHHEVGHNLDQDLRSGGCGQRIAEELRQKIVDRLAAAGVDPARRQIWTRWADEITADAFGVLLGGAGFAACLTALLVPQAPQHGEVVRNDEHPDAFVRIELIAQMLERCEIAPLSADASALRQRAAGLPQPSDLGPFLRQAAIVAELAIATPLDVLGGHRLRDLTPRLGEDAQRTQELAHYLSGRTPLRPKEWICHRLVPPAAQLALQQLEAHDEQALAELHERALTFIESIERPAFLGETGPDEGFLRTLAEEITF